MSCSLSQFLVTKKITFGGCLQDVGRKLRVFPGPTSEFSRAMLVKADGRIRHIAVT